ncbi:MULTISPECIES: BrnA antitoxin family protein [Edwardsiella]|uniref:BrnA antitoxin family protein n=1 Tax=Edwardsiella anguillarum TaxID=1821960 RepID=A0ABY8SAW7_9GAMM|nr:MULTISPECIES: BrnA antitoxin family protein [Edwardsiella]EKS7783474.1 BrnA antitoxin family protein [Edwardsiella piscicida]EKS7795061.1 BrnA antitoxin family protein [Edwardsiella piscicida]ELM3730481.1 BrnA antitoxin family protein [Edwardsiella piscicida]ELV7537896.1 BrnA antitoxin family protein [Edwardsiella piscicida]KAB0587630.1 BrnA antitoxin family protein [Edwardsiella anguillarum]
MSEKLKDLKSTWVDPDDAPELDEAFFAGADLYDGKKRVRRGRPSSDKPTKQSATIRYSPEVIAAFRSTGRGWQTRMDAALKDWLTQHNPADVKI